MVRYWDLSTKEKATLTEAQVKAFCDVQLMEKGIVNPGVLPEIVIPEMPVMQQEEWFEVCGLLVKTHEQASQILLAQPHISDYEYSMGYDRKFAKPCDGTVKVVKLFLRSEVLALRSVLVEIKEKTDEKEKREREYEKAFKACRDAVADIWTDYYESQEREALLQTIRDTYNKYQDMCDGDPSVAMRFLLNTYNKSDVCEALPNDVPQE